MWNLARCSCALLIASFAMALGAAAEEQEWQADGSDFVRTGFYLGAGGTAGFPQNWDNDFDNDLNEPATEQENQSAQDALDLINATRPRRDRLSLVPNSVMVTGTDLEDVLMGVNGVIGYRAGPRVAFEVEAEWLIDSNKTDLDVTTLAEPDPLNFIMGESTGQHTAEVGKISTFTANLKAYPPFTGRFQPFAKFGLGVQHSEIVINFATSGLTSIGETPAETVTFPSDFRFQATNTSVDGAIRAGAGIDIYATPNIVTEFNFAYVVPFSELRSMRTDFVAIQWRLIYRF